MTPEQLEALRAQADRHAQAIGPGGEKAWLAGLLAAAAPALLSEVERLRAELEQSRDRLDDDAWTRLQADRDKLSAELTVVRRERAWLISNLDDAELEEFRLLAQTAERAREDAEHNPQAETR